LTPPLRSVCHFDRKRKRKIRSAIPGVIGTGTDFKPVLLRADITVPGCGSGHAFYNLEIWRLSPKAGGAPVLLWMSFNQNELDEPPASEEREITPN
jgi:hypothetical protein